MFCKSFTKICFFTKVKSFQTIQCNMTFTHVNHIISIHSLWKTSCVVCVPKVKHPTEFKDFRPIALTSYIKKTLEKLVLSYLRLKMWPFIDSLQFAYEPYILGVDDALIYMLHRVYVHLYNLVQLSE